jgi:protein-histidine pros-kinase
MLIWIFGMAVVLAVSVALFDRERDRFGQNILFEGITREIVAAVDVLDHLTPGQRAEWIETLGRRPLHNEGWVIQQCAGGWLATMEQR